NSPNDMIISITETDTIGWILWDEVAPGKYRVWANDTNGNYYVWIDWSDWINNTDLQVPINKTSSGIFNYTIEFNNSFGGIGIPDSLNITIINPPVSNQPGSILTPTIGLENISWILQDEVGSGKYRVWVNYTNNDYYIWQDWQDWSNNTDLQVPINRSVVGIYNYTIEYNNSFGFFGIPNTTYVTVFENRTILHDGTSSPSYGKENTFFNFMVNFTDLDNRPPQEIKLNINQSTYVLQKMDVLDQNYQDGCIYNVSVQLSAGIYYYNFYAKGIFGDEVSYPYLAPNVNLTLQVYQDWKEEIRERVKKIKNILIDSFNFNLDYISYFTSLTINDSLNTINDEIFKKVFEYLADGFFKSAIDNIGSLGESSIQQGMSEFIIDLQDWFKTSGQDLMVDSLKETFNALGLLWGPGISVSSLNARLSEFYDLISKQQQIINKFQAFSDWLDGVTDSEPAFDLNEMINLLDNYYVSIFFNLHSGTSTFYLPNGVSVQLINFGDYMNIVQNIHDANSGLGFAGTTFSRVRQLVGYGNLVARGSIWGQSLGAINLAMKKAGDWIDKKIKELNLWGLGGQWLSSIYGAASFCNQTYVYPYILDEICNYIEGTQTGTLSLSSNSFKLSTSAANLEDIDGYLSDVNISNVISPDEYLTDIVNVHNLCPDSVQATLIQTVYVPINGSLVEIFKTFDSKQVSGSGTEQLTVYARAPSSDNFNMLPYLLDLELYLDSKLVDVHSGLFYVGTQELIDLVNDTANYTWNGTLQPGSTMLYQIETDGATSELVLKLLGSLSNMDIRIFDGDPNNGGNLTFGSYYNGTFVNLLDANYTGLDGNREFITIPNSGNANYTIEIVAVDLTKAEKYTLTVAELKEMPAILQADNFTSNIIINSSQTSFTFTLMLGNAGDANFTNLKIILDEISGNGITLQGNPSLIMVNLTNNSQTILLINYTLNSGTISPLSCFGRINITFENNTLIKSIFLNITFLPTTYFENLGGGTPATPFQWDFVIFLIILFITVGLSLTLGSYLYVHYKRREEPISKAIKPKLEKALQKQELKLKCFNCGKEYTEDQIAQFKQSNEINEITCVHCNESIQKMHCLNCEKEIELENLIQLYKGNELVCTECKELISLDKYKEKEPSQEEEKEKEEKQVDKEIERISKLGNFPKIYSAFIIMGILLISLHFFTTLALSPSKISPFTTFSTLTTPTGFFLTFLLLGLGMIGISIACLVKFRHKWESLILVGVYFLIYIAIQWLYPAFVYLYDPELSMLIYFTVPSEVVDFEFNLNGAMSSLIIIAFGLFSTLPIIKNISKKEKIENKRIPLMSIAMFLIAAILNILLPTGLNEEKILFILFLSLSILFLFVKPKYYSYIVFFMPLAIETVIMQLHLTIGNFIWSGFELSTIPILILGVIYSCIIIFGIILFSYSMIPNFKQKISEKIKKLKFLRIRNSRIIKK
ncbi:MAG: hypothetical protein ACTSX4_00725, partial [Candidatus Helarchaeota archaeon]